MLRRKDDASRAAPVNVTVEERDRPNIECDRVASVSKNRRRMAGS
ncbi:hypothetical protein [Thermoleptolyngbya sp.]